MNVCYSSAASQETFLLIFFSHEKDFLFLRLSIYFKLKPLPLDYDYMRRRAEIACRVRLQVVSYFRQR